MTFEHFEEQLSRKSSEDLKKYFEVFGRLREPTQSVLGYVMDIASFLNSSLLGDSYSVFGGYAVLSHIMQEMGEDVAPLWRGSVDIDMIGDINVLNALRTGYQIRNDRPSQNIPNKHTLKLVEDHEKECKIDFTLGDYHNEFPYTETNTHFGVDLKVASPLRLIKGKLYTPRNEKQHLQDIYSMLGLLERRGTSPRDVSHYLKQENRKELGKRVREARLESAGRLSLEPSPQFSKNLEKLLSK